MQETRTPEQNLGLAFCKACRGQGFHLDTLHDDLCERCGGTGVICADEEPERPTEKAS